MAVILKKIKQKYLHFMRNINKVVFGHPKWPPPAILNKYPKEVIVAY